jgi:hypothetical protein
MSGESGIAFILALLLQAQAGYGPIPTTVSTCPAQPIVIAAASATTEGEVTRASFTSALPMSASEVDDRRILLHNAITESTIVGRIVGAHLPQSQALSRYLLDISNAAVALHEHDLGTEGLRQFVAQLAQARHDLAQSVATYDEWVSIAKAVSPRAEFLEVPDRFVERADSPSRVWTAEDSELVKAASDFLRSTT